VKRRRTECNCGFCKFNGTHWATNEGPEAQLVTWTDMDESQCPECKDTVGKDAFGAYVIGAAKRLPKHW
jgi:hypothetical protein